MKDMWGNVVELSPRFRHPGCDEAHLTARTMYKCIQRRARSDLPSVARQVELRARHRYGDDGPWMHPACSTKHRSLKALRRCIRKQLNDVVCSPAFLSHRGPLRAYIVHRGWLT